MLRGKVFITGGTGSLGKAILHMAKQDGWPCEITVFSRDEVKQSELKHQYPEYRFVLGDVRDYDWLQLVTRGQDLIIHAAAYKQVVSSEVNAGEAIEVNVIGSRNIARAAVFNNIGRVIGISTDKACAPVNCYGETKALMERLFQQACLWNYGITKFHLVRYGNVLGSRGSVVPLFREQAREGYVTVTDPEMTRFWLTLQQAVNLVIDCYEMSAYPGSILIPKCPASTMQALAECFTHNIKITGTRAGEKKHEQLVHTSEAMNTDDIKSHFLVYPAYTLHKGNLPDNFEYRSDTAVQLCHQELMGMLDEKLH